MVLENEACFKSNVTQQSMPSFINIDETNYNPVKKFTAVELCVEKGNNAAFAITKMKAPMSISFLQLFEQFWQNKERGKGESNIQSAQYRVLRTCPPQD